MVNIFYQIRFARRVFSQNRDAASWMAVLQLRQLRPTDEGSRAETASKLTSPEKQTLGEPRFAKEVVHD